MRSAPTFTATIYCGLRESYAGPLHALADAEAICQAYCDRVGLGVTIAPIRFVYTKGAEPGVAVGLINYPRFPSTPEAIREHALTLAGLLKEALGQQRASVVFPGETVMLGEEVEQEQRQAGASAG